MSIIAFWDEKSSPIKIVRRRSLLNTLRLTSTSESKFQNRMVLSVEHVTNVPGGKAVLPSISGKT